MSKNLAVRFSLRGGFRTRLLLTGDGILSQARSHHGGEPRLPSKDFSIFVLDSGVKGTFYVLNKSREKRILQLFLIDIGLLQTAFGYIASLTKVRASLMLVLDSRKEEESDHNAFFNSLR